jgi:hypothetical protein
MASLIYKNLFLYRLTMNLLYTGSYKRRLRQVFPFIEGDSLLELCFADTYIAEWAAKKGIRWTGFDISEKFVTCAKKKGFDAQIADLRKLQELPKASVCLMCGSLYHFNLEPGKMIKKMLEAAPKVVICEPIKNLSSSGGLVGWIARKSAGTKNGMEEFRYNATSLIELLDEFSVQLNYSYRINGTFKKDITVILQK